MAEPHTGSSYRLFEGILTTSCLFGIAGALLVIYGICNNGLLKFNSYKSILVWSILQTIYLILSPTSITGIFLQSPNFCSAVAIHNGLSNGCFIALYPLLFDTLLNNIRWFKLYNSVLLVYVIGNGIVSVINCFTVTVMKMKWMVYLTLTLTCLMLLGAIIKHLIRYVKSNTDVYETLHIIRYNFLLLYSTVWLISTLLSNFMHEAIAFYISTIVQSCPVLIVLLLMYHEEKFRNRILNALTCGRHIESAKTQYRVNSHETNGDAVTLHINVTESIGNNHGMVPE